MNQPAIVISDLGKRYRRGVRTGSYKTFREAITGVLTAPYRRFRSLGGNFEGDAWFWALKDVTLTIQPGEVVGIIGRNGAGKSTLLKILSRITDPSAGEVRIRGRVGSLLEVGTGFHPELTGRENVYLNGAILGMKKTEIERKFDQIVAFAEVEDFLDTPVKHYSSGMYVRLGFAVAAHLEPEILIVDEVLAVGDAGFQKKCLRKMQEVAGGGRTVLFVSHNMAAVSKLCTRAALLDQGKVQFLGKVADAVERYTVEESDNGSPVNLQRRRADSDEVSITAAALQKDGLPAHSFLFGDRAELVLEIQVNKPVHFSVELLLRDEHDVPLALSPGSVDVPSSFEARPGRATIRCLLPRLELAQGKYTLDLMLAESGIRFLDYRESAVTFDVLETAIGDRNVVFRQSRGQGCFLWDVDYRFTQDVQ